MRDRRALMVAIALVIALTSCGGAGAGDGAQSEDTTAGSGGTATTAPATTAPATTAPATTAADTTTPAPTTAAPATPPLTRPDWLGTRVLPESPAEPLRTPPELDPRRLPTIDVLPPPSDGRFHAAIQAVTREVAARSTWQPSCPVPLGDLRYVMVSFWGFDGRPHTGELLVHRTAAEPLVGVFRRLFELRFPIEDVHVTSRAELHAPNTGDGNATAAFVCRPTRGGSRWSDHAYGLAVDINPFQNPYERSGAVTPGLATSYLDRANERPGMILPGAGVVEAFADIGWGWGGSWDNPTDYMHFSASGH